MNKVDMVNAAAQLLVTKGLERGDQDYSGFVDWLHPLGVAERVRKYGEVAYTVALLHDVVEDYEVTFEELTEMGFPTTVVAAIMFLTRKKDKETYPEYIERVAQNRLATIVKMADIMYNLSRVDYGLEPEKADRLRRRWLDALDVLRKALGAKL